MRDKDGKFINKTFPAFEAIEEMLNFTLECIGDKLIFGERPVNERMSVFINNWNVALDWTDKIIEEKLKNATDEN